MKKASRRRHKKIRTRIKPKRTQKHAHRRRAKQRKPMGTLPILLILIGLALVGLWGTHIYLYNRAISLSDALLASYAQEAQQTALPIHIVIGDKISLPVVEAGKVDGQWTVSQTSANHVRESALPGEGGNIIIYGHNLNVIFGFLADVKPGERIEIRMTDGALFEYQVTETHVVSPTKTELLAPTQKEVLTLYTCFGLLDSKRFVVRAMPVERVN